MPCPEVKRSLSHSSELELCIYMHLGLRFRIGFGYEPWDMIPLATMRTPTNGSMYLIAEMRVLFRGSLNREPMVNLKPRTLEPETCAATFPFNLWPFLGLQAV